MGRTRGIGGRKGTKLEWRYGMKTLLQLHRELLALQNNEQEIEKGYKSAIKKNKEEQKAIKGQIIYAKSSVNVDKIQEGIKLLALKFPTRNGTYSMIHNDIVDDAKKDLATGCEKLKNVYFGQKYYSGYDQREDHKYGYGPRHGYIYQSIGLRNPQETISDEQVEACLYTLENLETVLEVRNED